LTDARIAGNRQTGSAAATVVPGFQLAVTDLFADPI
jgi:hypothetical protein